MPGGRIITAVDLLSQTRIETASFLPTLCRPLTHDLPETTKSQVKDLSVALQPWSSFLTFTNSDHPQILTGPQKHT